MVIQQKWLHKEGFRRILLYHKCATLASINADLNPKYNYYNKDNLFQPKQK